MRSCTFNITQNSERRHSVGRRKPIRKRGPMRNGPSPVRQGEHPIDLYYAPTPNGWKVSIFLEEAELPYNIVSMRLGERDQDSPSFRSINPNGRIPAIVDHAPIEGDDPISLFESGAILFYLADKIGRFLPTGVSERAAVMQWLMWQMAGLGPMAGQNGHFLLYAPGAAPYATERFFNEVVRLYGVLDTQLERLGPFICGDYSIADMACFPWIMTHKKQQIPMDRFPHVARWFALVRQREAVQRGLAAGAGIASVNSVEAQAARQKLIEASRRPV
ncbi:glutathione S-transferase N-terminal domain-containing protein [Sphingobium sp. 15-1]|uniref:glutathione S-transferase N-terminal domain-containing protein n=1 Tax=Sphingobium sp. 15-1 TaxID=2729616 RepID=UPI0021013477|nr:glutathione S-transferase N-terminal domain-containing protein [Sphingobium sp. 15-1]